MIELTDGDSLGGGVVYSNVGGYHCAVYRCACGREQSAEHEMFNCGISPSLVAQCGWVRLESGNWSCPFCSGDEEKLAAVFKGSTKPEDKP